MVKSLFSFVFLTLIFAGKRCAFSSFSSYSHGADTHSAASAAFSSCSPVPAPSAFPENGSATFLIRRQQNLTVDMFLDQMADTRIFAWLDRRKSAGEFCIGCCCFPAKTGIYAPQTKILVNSCFRSSDPPARPLLLLFLFRRSKADDPRRLRRNHKQRQQNQKHAKQPEKKQRNTAQYRKNASPALLFRFSTPVICSADSELFSSTTFFCTESGLPTIF